MKFDEICSLGITSLSPKTKDGIAALSKKPVVFHEDVPTKGDEIAKRIGNADCLLVNVRTSITKEIIDKCGKLKYIGLYGTHPALIDVKHAESKKIAVTVVDHYCDHETAEFILAQLLVLHRGLRSMKWKSRPYSLKDKKIGIIGMGRVGATLAKMCAAMKMKVAYFSNSKNAECESLGIKHAALPTLLANCDIISLHTPPMTTVLRKKEFALIKAGTLLVNTCMGKSMEDSSLESWLEDKINYLFLDAVGMTFYPEVAKRENVIASALPAFDTQESHVRLNEMFLKNMQDWVAKNGK